MEIKLLSELIQTQKDQLLEVYKLTTNSQSPEVKYKYYDYYIENTPDSFFVAIDEDVCGYICGQDSTLDHYDLLDTHTYLDLFRSDIELFPAHLHINVHPKAQGKGVGGKLLKAFENYLKSLDISGVHIITVEGEENAKFYTKMGFEYSSCLSFQGKNLKLMGKYLK